MNLTYLFIRLFQPILAPPSILREMCNRAVEYVMPQTIRVSIGTYNVNGGKHFRSVAYKDLNLTDWLLDAHTLSRSKCKRMKTNFM